MSPTRRDHFLPWTPGRVLLFIAEAGSYSTPAQRAPILAIMPSAEFMAVPEVRGMWELFTLRALLREWRGVHGRARGA